MSAPTNAAPPAPDTDDAPPAPETLPLIALYGTTHDGLIKYIAKEYGLADGSKQFQSPARQRRDEIALRLRLYRDDAHADFAKKVDDTFDSAKNRNNRKKFIELASEQNVTRRIIDEVFSLYDQPAVRRLKANDAAFHVEEKRIGLHGLMQETSHLLGLCNEILMWSYAGIDGKQKLRIVTPDLFDTIPDPRDALVEAGILIDMPPITVLTGAAKAKLPHFELWDAKFRYRLNARGAMVDAAGNPATAPEEHGLGRIPGVLLHRRAPTDVILDARHGRDIISAHLGVVWLNLQLMWIAKSQAERQLYLKGNLANQAAGQSMDGENAIAVPPDVEIGVLDLQTDPQYLISQKKEKLANVSTSYGMSYEQLTLTDTSAAASGKAYQVRREKLTELRNEQRQRAKVHEAQIVTLLGFDADGMSVDHQEQAIPQDAVEEVQLLDLKMRLGLDSPRAYLMRKDPDLSPAEADAKMKANLLDWAVLITMVRALNIPGLADAFNPGAAPQINGSGKLVTKDNVAALDEGEATQSPPGAKPGIASAA